MVLEEIVIWKCVILVNEWKTTFIFTSFLSQFDGINFFFETCWLFESMMEIKHLEEWGEVNLLGNCILFVWVSFCRLYCADEKEFSLYHMSFPFINLPQDFWR